MRFAVLTEGQELEFRDVPDGADSLTALQSLVGGYIESPSILDPRISHLTMWDNEEGKLRPECVANHAATRFVGYEGYDVIFGNVVISGPVGPEGETTGLSDEDTALVKMVYEEAVR